MNLKFRKNKEIIPLKKRKEKRNDRILLILSGIMLGISFPPFPFPFQLFMFVGLIPYFSVIEKRTTLIDINRASYLAFFVFGVITLYWVGSWQESADPFLMISGFLLLFVNPLFLLIPSTIYYFARKIFPVFPVLYFFPLFWVSYEYAYMITDLTFPWLTLGNGLSHFTHFIQVADIIGALGLSLNVVLVNVLLYKFFIVYRLRKKISYINLLSFTIIFVFILIYGFIKISDYNLPDKKIRVGLIQPNIDPWKKWETGSLQDFTELYLNLSQQAVDNGAELIIWPETAIPVYLLSGAYNSTLNSIYNFVNKNNIYLLTGMPDIKYYNESDKLPDDIKYNESYGYYTTYNGILLLNPYSSEIQRYGKMKLVPFGERVPFVDQLPFLGDVLQWGVGISGWNVGKDTIVFKLKSDENDKLLPSEIDTLKVNGLVCYESIYPVFVSEFVRRGAELITVVTNDSWYGNSSGPYQHKEIAVLRAVENRRTVVRAANGGVSCIIDPLGKTVKETQMFTRDVLVGDVVIENRRTFFTNNSYIIPVISLVLSIWIIGIFILFKLKNRFNL